MFTEVKAKEDFATGRQTSSFSHLSCKPDDCSPPGNEDEDKDEDNDEVRHDDEGN